MAMGLDESRQESLALQVDDLSLRAFECFKLRSLAQDENFPVLKRQSLDVGLSRVDGDDVTAQKNGIGWRRLCGDRTDEQVKKRRK
jgi:hypothetical protein